MDTYKAADFNKLGLTFFEKGDLENSSRYLKLAYKQWSEQSGILINLGLALMQKGMHEEAERCYKIAKKTGDIKTKRAAFKNLGFLYLWRGDWDAGWRHHDKRFLGEEFRKNQWRGEPLNGQPLIVWNDVGMGDAFQFIRYTKELMTGMKKIIFAVDKNQIEIIKNYLNWELFNVIDRDSVMPPPN